VDEYVDRTASGLDRANDLGGGLGARQVGGHGEGVGIVGAQRGERSVGGRPAGPTGEGDALAALRQPQGNAPGQPGRGAGHQGETRGTSPVDLRSHGKSVRRHAFIALPWPRYRCRPSVSGC
jgi:hypothetical protein